MAEQTRREALAAMRRAAMFSALDDRAAERLLDECITRRYRAGTAVFSPFETADRFFAILSGRVKIFKLSARGDEQILHLYGQGETFGEAAMLAGGAFPAHAEAVSDASLLVVPRTVLRRVIARNADVAMGMLAGLSAKLKEFNRLIAELSLKDVPARVAGAVLEMSGRAGSATFRLKQTKRALAAQVGTTAETLSRSLRKLKAAGLIDVAGSRITILNRSGLANLAESG